MKSNKMTENTGSVLIADDNPRNLQLISTLLKDRGYKLYITTSGENAIRFLADNQPDLILLDIMMPGMSGFEVCRIIKNDELLSEIPVIFLTAKNDQEDIIAGFEAGAVDYIIKPFYAHEVLARVSAQMQIIQTKKILAEKNAALEQINKCLLEAKSKIENHAEELAALNAEKNKFFSIIAHDLRGPLAGLTGLSELLFLKLENTQETDAEEIIEFAKMLHDSSLQVFELLENLLEWAQIQMNTISFQPEKTPLRQLIINAIGIHQNDLKKKDLTLSIKVNENETVFGDQAMLKAIFRNLTTNAIKFTPKGGAIEIKAGRTNDQKIKIQFKDSGIGMDKSLIDKLFRLDQKVSRAGTEGEVSSGIGLILCKNLVDKHNGSIGVKSTPGKGTTFTVNLPLIAD